MSSTSAVEINIHAVSAWFMSFPCSNPRYDPMSSTASWKLEAVSWKL
jgi:hypothetical protein